MVLDTGATVITMPSKDARHAVRLNDAMALWRGASRVLYSVNEVQNRPRRSDGRVNLPLQFHLDSFVDRNAGALAYVGSNYVQAPFSWYDGFTDFEKVRWGSWGQFHEYGHHFQQNWGIGDYVEVTNNALNLISYSKMLEMTSTRTVDPQGEFYTIGKSWNLRTHPYNTISNKDLLTFYANYLFYFGHDKWRKILNAHITQKHYLRSQYGKHGEFLLTLCKMSNRDVRPYYKTFSQQGTQPYYLNYDTEISSEVNTLIDQMGLRELHPVALLYQTGYVFDGEEIETARPFRIPCRSPYKFDFVKYMRSCSGCHEFAFDSYEGGQGTLTQVSNGIYTYTPPDDVNVIDKFYVKYRDTTNQDITKVIVKIQQALNGISVYYYKLGRTMLNINNAYDRMLSLKNEAILQMASGITIPDPNYPRAVGWVSMAEGIFVPEKTAPYKFIFIHVRDCEFYISENPLPNDATQAAPYKYVTLYNYEVSWNKDSSGPYKQLEAGKRYYFRLVMVNNNGGSGRAEVGYINADNEDVKQITSHTQFVDQRAEDVDKYEFVPQIENDPTLGHYADSRELKHDNRKYKITTGNRQASADAITYNVNLNGQVEFDKLRIPNIFNPGTFQISCDGTEIYNQYFDPYPQPELEFSQHHTCKSLTLTTAVNQIASIELMLKVAGTTDNIIPATHTKFHLTGSGSLSREGVYYNGKWWHLNKGARLTCNVQLNETGNSIVIVGDRHLNYGGGILEVYIGTKFHGYVDTAFIAQDVVNKMATNNYYQSILYCINGLQPNSQQIVSLVARKGKVQIAGLLANANLQQVSEPLPTLEYPPDSMYDGFTEDDNDDDNGGDNGNGDKTAPPANAPTSTPSGPPSKQKTDETDKKKLPTILGATIGTVAVVGGAVSAVFLIKMVKAKGSVMSDGMAKAEDAPPV